MLEWFRESYAQWTSDETEIVKTCSFSVHGAQGAKRYAVNCSDVLQLTPHALFFPDLLQSVKRGENPMARNLFFFDFTGQYQDAEDVLDDIVVQIT